MAKEWEKYRGGIDTIYDNRDTMLDDSDETKDLFEKNGLGVLIAIPKGFPGAI